MADPREFLFKVIVVGEANVGKTSIVHRYVEGTFSSKYKYTIGGTPRAPWFACAHLCAVDFALKVLNIDDSTVVRLQLWYACVLRRALSAPCAGILQGRTDSV